ncbi:MAG: hypothetical protein CEE41_04475 [Hadesarchaea archaeon B3_Hades]|nr:MAG: hypothetical protein CEE41_04475 [Hadesarchaea archaeon B3_Hades]
MKKEDKPPHGGQLLIRAVVRDPEGKIISDTGRKPARSFVIQFLEAIYYLFMKSGSAAGDATKTDGSEDLMYSGAYDCQIHYELNAPINVSSYGLVVGTGDTAETNEDYKLETQLTEGVTVGKITHGAVSVGTAGEVGANVDVDIKRAFTNATGSLITVKEAGAYIESMGTRRFCLIRAVLPAGVEVPDKCSLTVIYTVRTAV